MKNSFESRAYNKACKKEQEACMKETMKGIVLDGESTGNMGSIKYPTMGASRKLAMEGGPLKNDLAIGMGEEDNA